MKPRQLHLLWITLAGCFGVLWLVLATYGCTTRPVNPPGVVMRHAPESVCRALLDRATASGLHEDYAEAERHCGAIF